MEGEWSPPEEGILLATSVECFAEEAEEQVHGLQQATIWSSGGYRRTVHGMHCSLHGHYELKIHGTARCA